MRLPGSIWLKVVGFGLLAGAATLVRPTGLLLPGLVLLLPGLGPARGAAGAASRNARYRQLWHASRRVRLTLVAIVGAALIVVPVMVWNKRTHGVFALTSSLQRNMLYPIEAAPRRLLQGRGGGDPLLGQVKATISHHPTSPWTGPYGGLLDRFHLSNEALDRLLMRVALDFILADPLAYVVHIVVRLPPFLTGSGANAAGLVQYGRQEYIIAGGPSRLGVSGYDYGAELETAQAFDQQTGFLHYSHYSWVLIAFAAFGGTRHYGRSAMLVAIILAIAAVSVGTVNSGIPIRYRYPMHWGGLSPRRRGTCGACCRTWRGAALSVRLVESPLDRSELAGDATTGSYAVEHRSTYYGNHYCWIGVGSQHCPLSLPGKLTPGPHFGAQCPARRS